MKDYKLSKEKIVELWTVALKRAFLFYGRIKRGQERELEANCGRQRLNINGAINIETLASCCPIKDSDCSYAYVSSVNSRRMAAAVPMISALSPAFAGTMLICRERLSNTSVAICCLIASARWSKHSMHT